MQWFIDMRIMNKLLLSFGIILSIMAGLGWFASIQMAEVNDKSTEISHNWLPSVQACGELNAMIREVRIAEYGHVISEDEKNMAEFENALSNTQPRCSMSDPNTKSSPAWKRKVVFTKNSSSIGIST